MGGTRHTRLRRPDHTVTMAARIMDVSPAPLQPLITPSIAEDSPPDSSEDHTRTRTRAATRASEPLPRTRIGRWRSITRRWRRRRCRRRRCGPMCPRCAATWPGWSTPTCSVTRSLTATPGTGRYVTTARICCHLPALTAALHGPAQRGSTVRAPIRVDRQSIVGIVDQAPRRRRRTRLLARLATRVGT